MRTLLPFGVASLVRAGSEITVVTWGAMVERCEQAAAQSHVDAEVLDLRTLSPWDKAAVLASVAKTRRCLIVHEDNLTAGFGAEIAATLAQECFFNLDAPIERLAMPDIPESAQSPAARGRGAERGTHHAQPAASCEPVDAPAMSDHVEVRAPAEQTEGTRSQILRWLKQPGESVTENEPLIEIETDKVTVEVASPAAGVLREILKHEQEEIAPGELLGRIEAGGAGVASRPTAAAASPPAQPLLPPRRGSAGALARERGAQSRGAAPAQRARARGERGRRQRPFGPHHGRGRAARSRRRTRGDAPPSRTPLAAAPAGAATRRVPHSAVRKRIAEHMVQSLLHTAPHVTSVFEADMSAVLQDRARQREAFARAGVPLTLTAYFVQAAVAALRAVPEANSRWTETALEIYESMNIGIATAVEGTGLVVPVLREAQARDLLETARGLDDLVQRARAGKLTPADVRGGTFTISNHGVSGSLLAAPIIINQPQSAILGDRQARAARGGGARGRSGAHRSAAALLCDAHRRSPRDGRP